MLIKTKLQSRCHKKFKEHYYAQDKPLTHCSYKIEYGISLVRAAPIQILKRQNSFEYLFGVILSPCTFSGNGYRWHRQCHLYHPKMAFKAISKVIVISGEFSSVIPSIRNCKLFSMTCTISVCAWQAFISLPTVSRLHICHDSDHAFVCSFDQSLLDDNRHNCLQLNYNIFFLRFQIA